MTGRCYDASYPATEPARLRPRLFGIAYRMLGSVADAEDAVQETLLRWEQAHAKGTEIAVPEAWMVAVVTRLCIDHLRSARVRQEQYVGQWLPEPLVEGPGSPAEAVELAESLSLAFLVLLERLAPVERAVFLLHEVFGYPFAEIAPIVGKGEAACRQLAKRARDRVGVGQPRFQAPAVAGERLAAEFLRACVDGDLPALIGLLTEDVELVADGGGKVATAPNALRGVDPVARFLLGIARLGPDDWTASPATVNGGPGLLARDGAGRPFAVLALEPSGERIAAVRIVINPDKLHGVPDDGDDPIASEPEARSTGPVRDGSRPWG